MKVYNFRTFHDAGYEISEAEMTRISSYTRKDVSGMLGYYNSTGHKYWKILTDAALIIYHHPDPIVRHEADFVLGEFQYKREVDKTVAVRHLIHRFKQESSIVARHEAVEAAGALYSPTASVSAAAHLAKMLRFRDGHQDVLATAEEAFNSLIERLRKEEGYESVVNTLLAWRDPAVEV